MLICESSVLSSIHPIEEALKFFHVAHEEEAPHNSSPLIFIEHSRCNHVSIGVHRAHLISTVIYFEKDLVMNRDVLHTPCFK